MKITLRQAMKLVEFFGGHDAEVSVADRLPNATLDQPPGLYAWCTEYPEEGAQYLGPTEVDDTLASEGLPSVQPPRFPTMLRKMWSGGEVQAWITEHWPTAATARLPGPARASARQSRKVPALSVAEIQAIDPTAQSEAARTQLAFVANRAVQAAAEKWGLRAVDDLEEYAAPPDDAAELLRIFRTHLGTSRERCDASGKALWDRIEAIVPEQLQAVGAASAK